VELANGERIIADAVLFNGDAAALPSLGAPGPKPVQRSLSAITWCVNAPTSGFDLAHHNVFFAEDYAEEFRAIFNRREVTAAPTIYICAQDRGLQPPPPDTPERLLLLINAPADGDSRDFNASDYIARTHSLLASCGLHIGEGSAVATTPSGFNALFPATGGALYGMASHGATATLRRSGARGKIPGLYLAGGLAQQRVCRRTGPGSVAGAAQRRRAVLLVFKPGAGQAVRAGGQRQLAQGGGADADHHRVVGWHVDGCWTGADSPAAWPALNLLRMIRRPLCQPYNPWQS
jgi:1-hydroxycarotenoid 3,4-desaturase